LPNKQTYWFRAKRYGWGWGLPSAWQGWLVLAAFVCLLAAGFWLFPPDSKLAYFLSYTAVLILVLIAICWVKGEPPRWRWGDRDDA